MHAERTAPRRSGPARSTRISNYQLIWIDGDRPSDQYRQLVKALDAADDHGLPRSLYRDCRSTIRRATVRRSLRSRRPKLDARLTAAFLRYFTHLLGGRLDPRALQSLWTLKPEKPDLVDALSSAVKNERSGRGSWSAFSLSNPSIASFRTALVRYRAIAAKGGWPSIPADTRLKPNQQSPAVPALRQRLAIEGDLDPAHENDPSPVFDADTSPMR